MIFVKFTKTTGFKKAYMPILKVAKNEPLQYQMLINFLVLGVHLKVTHTYANLQLKPSYDLPNL